MAMVLFHYAHAVCLLLAICAVSLWASAEASSRFEALLLSYSLIGGVCYLVGGSAIALGANFWLSDYWIAYSVLAALYSCATALFVWSSILRVRQLRGDMRVERGRRARRRVRPRRAEGTPRRPIPRPSRLHPKALPIRGSPLFWKEAIKDGNGWSLSYRWPLRFLLATVTLAVALRLLFMYVETLPPHEKREGSLALSVLGCMTCFSIYFFSLAGYAVWTMFRATATVARERELHTLDFILLLPLSRFEILVQKWLGAVWPGWPLLVVAAAAVLFAWISTLISAWSALLLLVLPVPALLFFSVLGLFLSVFCKRVISANVIAASAPVVLVFAHLLDFARPASLSLFYAQAIFGIPSRSTDREWHGALLLAIAQQGSLLFCAGLLGCAAYWLFNRRTSDDHGLAW